MTHPIVSAEERERWRAALDAFAAGLAAGWRTLTASESPGLAVDDGRPDNDADGRTGSGGGTTATGVAPVWPPAQLPTGPVPDDLRAEAEALLDRAVTLREELTAAMQRSRPTGRRPTSPVAASPRWSVRL